MAAQAIPNFWMNIMLIPNDICEKIERRMNAFWWGCGNANNKGIHWLSWEKLCVMKDARGLGFKKLREFNIVMLAKQAWRLNNNSNPLVTQSMKARYYPNSDFLDANLGNNPSYVWRSILETRVVIKRGSRKWIGNGEDTLVSSVPWLPYSNNGFLTTIMPEELKYTKVQNLMDENRRQWDEDILNDLCNERDKLLIKQIPIPICSREDSWYWILDEKGEFSVKSCYRCLQGEADCTNKAFWRRIWRMQLPGKVINLIWRALRAILPTTVALQCKRVNVDTNYGRCQGGSETEVHVFFECTFAKEIWEMLGLLTIVRTKEGDTVMCVLKRALQSASKEQGLIIGLICWCLWLRRNKWVWEKINMSAFRIKSMALNMLTDWRKAREQGDRSKVSLQEQRRQWSKPPVGLIKINLDASCRQGNEYIGAGCVVRDDEGKFVRARTLLVRGRSFVREAEALSLKEALSWLKTWRRNSCIFESDSKVLVDAI